MEPNGDFAPELLGFLRSCAARLSGRQAFLLASRFAFGGAILGLAVLAATRLTDGAFAPAAAVPVGLALLSAAVLAWRRRFTPGEAAAFLDARHATRGLLANAHEGLPRRTEGLRPLLLEEARGALPEIRRRGLGGFRPPREGGLFLLAVATGIVLYFIPPLGASAREREERAREERDRRLLLLEQAARAGGAGGAEGKLLDELLAEMRKDPDSERSRSLLLAVRAAFVRAARLEECRRFLAEAVSKVSGGRELGAALREGRRPAALAALPSFARAAAALDAEGKALLVGGISGLREEFADIEDLKPGWTAVLAALKRSEPEEIEKGFERVMAALFGGPSPEALRRIEVPFAALEAAAGSRPAPSKPGSGAGAEKGQPPPPGTTQDPAAPSLAPAPPLSPHLVPAYSPGDLEGVPLRWRGVVERYFGGSY